jgi:hypothetical protein
MLSGIIAYQLLQQENPQTIDKVKAVLESQKLTVIILVATVCGRAHSHSN